MVLDLHLASRVEWICAWCSFGLVDKYSRTAPLNQPGTINYYVYGKAARGLVKTRILSISRGLFNKKGNCFHVTVSPEKTGARGPIFRSCDGPFAAERAGRDRGALLGHLSKRTCFFSDRNMQHENLELASDLVSLRSCSKCVLPWSRSIRGEDTNKAAEPSCVASLLRTSQRERKAEGGDTGR